MLLTWVWLLLAAAVAVTAIEMGRSGARWFLYAMLLLPIAMVHLAIIHAWRRLLGRQLGLEDLARHIGG